MKAPGLTAAMRRDLKLVLDGKAALVPQNRINRLMVSGFIDRSEAITPSGQAALAAPRMTAAELEWMERIGVEALIPTGILPKVVQGLFDKGWIQQYAGLWFQFTPAGLTALNNMRAAMGSAEWRANEDV